MGIIKPSPYPDGTYKRSRPKVVMSMVLDVYPEEAKAIREGKRRCSCEAQQLSRLGEKCANIAREVGAPSWSIYPCPGTEVGVPKVYVEWHSWPKMGLCNHKMPIANKRYIWEWTPIPEWISPHDERAERHRENTAFNPEA